MKKVRNSIAGLLAVYMLVLVVLPCNDHCLSNNQKTTLIFQGAHDNHDSDNDICSPFCGCSCCSTLITLSQPFEVETFVQQIDADYPLYATSFVSVFAFDCWQPPRLV